MQHFPNVIMQQFLVFVITSAHSRVERRTENHNYLNGKNPLNSVELESDFIECAQNHIRSLSQKCHLHVNLITIIYCSYLEKKPPVKKTYASHHVDVTSHGIL